mmetsp:Transcript_56211/g.93672  ORF Transcript_56211/g.93672 Transcript_56211/m.93672 type:complete len:317 (+) Transcript_56211:648-1598(+)
MKNTSNPALLLLCSSRTFGIFKRAYQRGINTVQLHFVHDRVNRHPHLLHGVILFERRNIQINLIGSVRVLIVLVLLFLLLFIVIIIGVLKTMNQRLFNAIQSHFVHDRVSRHSHILHTLVLGQTRIARFHILLFLFLSFVLLRRAWVLKLRNILRSHLWIHLHSIHDGIHRKSHLLHFGVFLEFGVGFTLVAVCFLRLTLRIRFWIEKPVLLFLGDTILRHLVTQRILWQDFLHFRIFCHFSVERSILIVFCIIMIVVAGFFTSTTATSNNRLQIPFNFIGFKAVHFHFVAHGIVRHAHFTHLVILSILQFFRVDF